MGRMLCCPRAAVPAPLSHASSHTGHGTAERADGKLWPRSSQQQGKNNRKFYLTKMRICPAAQLLEVRHAMLAVLVTQRSICTYRVYCTYISRRIWDSGQKKIADIGSSSQQQQAAQHVLPRVLLFYLGRYLLHQHLPVNNICTYSMPQLKQEPATL